MNKRGLGGIILVVLFIIFIAVVFYKSYSSPEKGNETVNGNETANINETEELEDVNDSTTQIINETHTTCLNNSCAEVEGSGADECNADTDCELIIEAKPDLIISNISSKVTSNKTNSTTNVTTYYVKVSVTVKNIGGADAEQSITKVSFLGFSPKNIFTPAITKGGEVKLEDAYELSEKGEYNVIALTDIQLNIDEIDEKNGSGFVKLRVF